MVPPPRGAKRSGRYPIGILGSGSAARTLGSGLLRLGHPVMLGTRDPGKLADWRDDAGPGAQIGSFAEAAVYGERPGVGINPACRLLIVA